MNVNRLFTQSKHNRLLLFLPSLKKEKKEKIGAKFVDANLTWVAPKCWVVGELACRYRDTFSQSA
jgi:hypothetical protein